MDVLNWQIIIIKLKQKIIFQMKIIIAQFKWKWIKLEIDLKAV